MRGSLLETQGLEREQWIFYPTSSLCSIYAGGATEATSSPSTTTVSTIASSAGSVALTKDRSGLEATSAG